MVKGESCVKFRDFSSPSVHFKKDTLRLTCSSISDARSPADASVDGLPPASDGSLPPGPANHPLQLRLSLADLCACLLLSFVPELA